MMRARNRLAVFGWFYWVNHTMRSWGFLVKPTWKAGMEPGEECELGKPPGQSLHTEL